MGNQVNFFASPSDLKQLFYRMSEKDVIILSTVGDVLNAEDVFDRIESDYRGKTFGESNVCIACSNSNIVYTFFENHKSIDQLQSEVIQFNACIQMPKKVLDKSSVYNHFKKEGFIVIHDTAEYQRRMDELMKHPIYINNPNYINNGFEHGRFWYAPSYYDCCGSKVYKSKEIEHLYKFIANYIHRFYMPSKDRFGYIAPFAYQEYLKGNFIPCSGKNMVEF